MKLTELLLLITEQTMIELSYLDGSDTRVACCCDDVHSVVDYVRERGRDITELTVVSVGTCVIHYSGRKYYFNTEIEHIVPTLLPLKESLIWGHVNFALICSSIVINLKELRLRIHQRTLKSGLSYVLRSILLFLKRRHNIEGLILIIITLLALVCTVAHW